MHSGTEAVHVSGHAKAGELQTLMQVTKPECFVPVHGEYRHLVHHARLGLGMGIAPANVLLCEDGDAVSLSAKGIKRDGKVPAGYVYVDGTVGDIGHGVLRDRQKLAEEGVVMVVVTVDNHEGSLSCPPVIETRGWVHAPEAEELLYLGGGIGLVPGDQAEDALKGRRRPGFRPNVILSPVRATHSKG